MWHFHLQIICIIYSPMLKWKVLQLSLFRKKISFLFERLINILLHTEKSHNSSLKEEKIDRWVCAWWLIIKQEILPKLSGTPSTARDFCWTYHTQLHAVSVSPVVVDLDKYLGGRIHLQHKSSRHGASCSYFPSSADSLKGTFPGPRWTGTRARSEQFHISQTVLWLFIDSDLLLWPEIKVSTVFI